MIKFQFSPKKFIIEAMKLLVMVVIIANVVSYIKKPTFENNILPDITVTLLDGNQKSLQSNAGKPLILYFWGSWCPICKISSPVLSTLSEQYQVVSVAVNSGSKEDIRHFMNQHNLHFPTVNDKEGLIAQKFGVTTFPTTFIYNAKGENSFTDVGYTSSYSLRFKIWLSQFIN